jgi:DNA-directed RNA polymerase specialized sigma24 family protein
MHLPRPDRRDVTDPAQAAVGLALAALARLYDAHHQCGLSLAYRLLGNHRDAEEVVEEALLAVWRASARCNRASWSARTRLLAAVRQRAVEVLRARQGRSVCRVVPEWEQVHGVLSQPTGSMTAEDDLERRAAAAWAVAARCTAVSAEGRAVGAWISVLGACGEAADVRGMAAQQLAALRSRGAVASLVTALGDPSADVRFWAAFALGELGSADIVPELAHLAATDEAVVPGCWSVGQDAAEAIVRIGERRLEPAVELVLSSTSPRPQRPVAGAAVARRPLASRRSGSAPRLPRGFGGPNRAARRSGLREPVGVGPSRS